MDADRRRMPLAGSGPVPVVRGLVRTFRHVRAVDGVDLEVGPSERVALLGANGVARPPPC